MPWPLSQDYNEAIQSPDSSFADAELCGGQAVNNALGMPMPRSGNFADVYEFIGASGAKWAIKCFTREVPGLQERYHQIDLHLLKVRLPFTVNFQYQPGGIRIRGQWFPILKMQWVEGFLLNEFVRNNLDKPALLEGLGQIWLRMAKRLREADMAHADLQHGNVLLVPGSKATSLAVKLIDYDGMFVPALAQTRSGEVGHPNYQHPQRLREGTYSAQVDRFPLLVVATALRALALGGRRLWDRFDNGDNLLFREPDLKAPEKSALFKELHSLADPQLRKLAEELHKSSARKLEDAPAIDELLPEPKRPAVKATAGAVAVGMPPAQANGEQAGEAALIEAAPAAGPDPWDFSAAAPADVTPKFKEKRGGVPAWALIGGGLAVVAVVFLLLAVGIVAVFLSRPKAGDPLAQNKPGGDAEIDANKGKKLPIKDPDKDKPPPKDPDKDKPPFKEVVNPIKDKPGVLIGLVKPVFIVELPKSAGRACLSADGLRAAYALPVAGKLGYREGPAFDVDQEITLEGAHSQIQPLASSPDGKKMALAGSTPRGTEVFVWDWAAKKVEARFVTLGMATEGAFSPDGNYLICSTIRVGNKAADQVWVHLYEWAAGRMPSQWSFPDELNFMGFTPDSKKVLLGVNKESDTRTWTMAGGAPGTIAFPKSKTLTKSFFSPDFSRFAFLETDTQLKLAPFDNLHAISVVNIAGDRFHLRGAAFSADNRFLLVGMQDHAKRPDLRGQGMLFDLKEAKTVSNTGGFTGVPDRVALAGNGIGMFQGPDLTPRLYRFLADGPGVLAKKNPPIGDPLNPDVPVVLALESRKAPELIVELPKNALRACMSADGRRVAYSDGPLGYFYYREAPAFDVEKKVTMDPKVRIEPGASSLDGKKMTFTSLRLEGNKFGNPKVLVWNWETMKVEMELAIPHAANGTVLSSDMKYLAIYSLWYVEANKKHTFSVSLVDVSKAKELSSWQADGPFIGYGFTPDSTKLIYRKFNEDVWRAYSIEGLTASVLNLSKRGFFTSFSADFTHCAQIEGTAKQLHVTAVDPPRPVRTLQSPQEKLHIRAAAVSPDNRFLIVGLQDTTKQPDIVSHAVLVNLKDGEVLGATGPRDGMIDRIQVTANGLALLQGFKHPASLFRFPTSPNLVVKKNPPADGFVPLFNGTDLTGWKTNQEKPGNWRVEDGVLVGSGPELGLLHTTRGDYKDFHLRVEARITDSGADSSGASWRSSFGNFGYETLMKNKKLEGAFFVRSNNMPRYISNTNAPNVGSGEWFTLEVIAEGNRFKVQVNGKVTNGCQDATNEFPFGQIALRQGPGSKLEIRKIEIKELPSAKNDGKAIELSAENGPAMYTGNLVENDPLYKQKKHRLVLVNMVEGKSYQIDMKSRQLDSFLFLESPTGELLAQDDDGGGVPDARIIHKATATGKHRVICTYFGNGIKLGEFTLTVRQTDGAKPVASKRFPATVPANSAGAWRVQGEELVQNSTKLNQRIFFGDPQWTDYDFQVEVMRTKGDDRFGLFFRRAGDDRWYVFQLGAARNMAHLVKMQNGTAFSQPAVQDAKDHPLQNGRWHTAKVKVRKEQGECYLDGVKLFDFKADKHAAGAVGLESTASSYRFKNLKVTAPDGTVLQEGLPDLTPSGAP